MTGRGPRRGAADDDPSWSGAAEVEELPAQPVIQRGTPRLGMSGILAIGAMVALVAAGFGVLGGRPNSEPGVTSGAIGPSADPVATPIVAPAASPLVTPWIECGEPPTTAPRVFLEVAGRPIEGAVEVVEYAIGVSPPPGSVSPRPSQPRERIEVPVDVISELWVVGSACAVAWNIDLVEGHTLESLANQTLDPAYAAQNRFQLLLAPHGDGDFQLRAVLVFPRLVARATWPIRVSAIEDPVAVLHTEGRDIRPVDGCDVTLTLATGVELPRDTCVNDVREPPADDTPVRPGERLTFEIEGWRTDAGGVACGRLSGQSFVGRSEAECDVRLDRPAPFVFEAPRKPGRWTLAMSACGNRAASMGAGLNSICGTWYANIVVED